MRLKTGRPIREVDSDESEALFRRRIIKFAKLRNWLVFYTADSIGSVPGEFDLRLYRPPRVIHAELKSQYGYLSPDQKRVRTVYEGCPCLEVYVWKPADQAQIWETLN